MGSSSSKWWLRASSNTGHSVIKCTSISSAWPHRWHVAGSGWSWFLVILLRYHANSGVSSCMEAWKHRVLCEGVKSFSWSLFTYVAWGTAGLAILLHVRAQWCYMTVLAALKSTGAADCGNVEASFAIQSARMFPSIPPWPEIHWNVICALPPVVVVVAYSSSPSLVVVKLEKISHRIWIVPYILGCQLCRACRALEQMFNGVWCHSTVWANITRAVMRAL